MRAIFDVRTKGVLVVARKAAHRSLGPDQKIEALPVDGQVFKAGHRQKLKYPNIPSFSGTAHTQRPATAGVAVDRVAGVPLPVSEIEGPARPRTGGRGTPE